MQPTTAAVAATTVHLGKVRMTVTREMRLRHVSDSPGPNGVAFGGDRMGQWNVSRILRILDAMGAPTIAMPINQPTMLNMARVGDPDLGRAQSYARMGRASMPPLTFVALPAGEDTKTLRTMLVDGHHRMLALCLLGTTIVPARVLPPELADDVRIVEMIEAAVFPTPDFAMNEVEIRGTSIVR